MFARASLVLAGLLVVAPSRASGQDEPGDVLAVQEISATDGGLPVPPSIGDELGRAVAALGDLDGDGALDVALGAPFRDGGRPVPGTPQKHLDRGAVWLLLLAADGTVRAQIAIGPDTPALAGLLDVDARFGSALAPLADLDGNGTGELAVGVPGHDGGRGRVLVLFLTADGAVTDAIAIDTDPDAGAEAFGSALAALDDVDGNGVGDLAVGAPGADAIDVVFLGQVAGGGRDASARDGEGGLVLGRTRLDARTPGLPAPLPRGAGFGDALARADDLDDDGRDELLVGLPGAGSAGALWWLALDADGAVTVSAVIDGPALALGRGDAFGAALHGAGDLDADGRAEILVGAPGSDAGLGRVWILFLDAELSVVTARAIDAASMPLAGLLDAGDRLGAAVTALGDLDGDERPDAFLGAPGLDGTAPDTGGGFVAFLFATIPPGGDPFAPPFVGALEGRAGRPSLTLPPDPGDGGGDEAIGDPVVIVPRASGSSVGAAAASASNGGGLEFASAGDFGTGAGPSMAATAGFTSGSDFDDILTANKVAGTVSFLQAQDLPGEPPYADQVEIALPFDGAPVAIVPGSFGSTAGLGFAVAGDVGVTAFDGDGAGGFTPIDFQPILALTDLAVGDVNGDSFDDVVTTSGGIAQGPGAELGFASVLLGDAIGSLTPAGTFADGFALASVLLLDADIDGDLDALLVAHQLDAGPLGEPQSLIDLWDNDGVGVFTLSPSTPALATPSALGIHPTYGDVADVDGDGLVDVVYASSDNIALPPDTFEGVYAPIRLTVLLADGAGGFTGGEVATAYSGKGVAPLLEDLAPEPLDGNVDCVLVWYEDANAGQGGLGQDLQTFVALLAGDGEGGFFDPAPNQFVAGDQPGSPAVGQLDPGPGDQGRDVAVASFASNSLTLLLGDGEGGIASTRTVGDVDELDPATLPPFYVGGPREVALGDLDGLAGDDVVVANLWEDSSPLLPSPQVFASLSLYVTLGGGDLLKTQYLVLPAGGDVAIGPIDGDAPADVVVALSEGVLGPDDLLLLPGLGDGTVGAPIPFSLPAGLRPSGGLALADLDDDGDLDAVTTAADLSPGGAGLIVTWRNDAGTLVPLPQALGPSWTDVRSLDLGDLDGDGLLDAAIGTGAGDLRLATGAGDGTFTAQDVAPPAGGVGGGALRLADVDGDGALDVISSNATAGSQAQQDFVRILTNDGDGDFDVSVLAGLSSSGALGALRPAVADMDGDGATDTVLSHGDAGTLSILLNGLNTFEAFGPGKPGAGGFVPQLCGSGYTTLGGTLSLQVTDGVGGAPALLQVGAGRVEDGFLAVESVALVAPLMLAGPPGQPRAGTWTWSTKVRDMIEFSGFEIVTQVLVYDEQAMGAEPVKIAATNGLAFTIQP